MINPHDRKAETDCRLRRTGAIDQLDDRAGAGGRPDRGIRFAAVPAAESLADRRFHGGFIEMTGDIET